MPDARLSPGATARVVPPLHIAVTSGVGTGSTKLAAFDAALRQAGVANYNLIRLSSVVPPGSLIEVGPRPGGDDDGAWGDRLYIVLAECRVDTVHEEAWAGIGWVQDHSTGRGLFVEHEGHSRAQVEADIDSSLDDLMAGRRSMAFGEKHSVVEGATCTEEPLCALVVAAFGADRWPHTDVIELP